MMRAVATKVCVSLAVLSLAMASSAWAQTPPTEAAAPAASPAPAPLEAAVACGPVPEMPPQPDISTERNFKVVSSYTDKLNAFITSANLNLECRKAAIQAESELVKARQMSVNAAVDAYKSDATTLRAAVDKWKADVDAFNARQKPATRGR